MFITLPSLVFNANNPSPALVVKVTLSPLEIVDGVAFTVATKINLSAGVPFGFRMSYFTIP